MDNRIIPWVTITHQWHATYPVASYAANARKTEPELLTGKHSKGWTPEEKPKKTILLRGCDLLKGCFVFGLSSGTQKQRWN